MREELLALNCQQSTNYKALFRFYDGPKPVGLLLPHVDDFLYAGEQSFRDQVIERVCSKFKIGSQGSDFFKYIELEIKHSQYGTVLVQNDYAATIKEIAISNARSMHKYCELKEIELKQLRSLIGQLNWIANQSRPDLSFDVLQLGNRIKNAKVKDITLANKVLRKLKLHECKLLFPDLGDLPKLKLVLYNDAACANPCDGVSSTGRRISFLAGNGRCCPISWSSIKVKRVVKSSLAAESSSLVDGLDTAYCIGRLFTEITYNECDVTKIATQAFVDNKSLVQSVYPTTLVSEKRLRVDLAATQQTVKRRQATLKWISSEEQIADCLTKAGAPPNKLLDIIKRGVIHLYSSEQK